MKPKTLATNALWLAMTSSLLPLSLQAFNLGDTVPAIQFNEESHPNDDSNIRIMGDKVGYINNGNWIRFAGFDFEYGAQEITIFASSPNGGNVELRTGSENGTIISTVSIGVTGGWNKFLPFTAPVDSNITDLQDLYLVFSGGIDIQSFNFANDVDVGNEYAADSFDEESHPNDDGNIRDLNTNDPLDTGIGNIRSGNWVKYNAFDFGASSPQSLTMYGATDKPNSKRISVRLDNPGGEEIAMIDVTNTTTFSNYQAFTTDDISINAKGVRDLFFVFEHNNVNISSFKFEATTCDVASFIMAASYDDESAPLDDNTIRNMGSKVGYIQNGSWIAFNSFDLGKGPASVTVSGTSPNTGGEVEFRLGSPTGTLIGTVQVEKTGNWNTFQNFSAPINAYAVGNNDLYLVFNGGFDIASFQFNWEPVGLNVYPAVENLAASPRYSFRVREVGSETWQTPFAFFTKCEDYDEIGDEPDYIEGDPANSNPNYTKLKANGELVLKNPDSHKTAYFAKFMGSWSHTYCNFEMAENTPIEVEITRIDGTPITSAVAHPARKVTSCSVIGGKVIVTLDNPALFAVDINGQMDNNDAPRASWAWNEESYPYRTPETAFHTVSVFANPYIVDKPLPNGPGVHMVEPGNRPNPGPNDTVVYFKPGVHDIVPLGTAFETFTEDSPIWLESGMSYYIPGDALIHGNFIDADKPGLTRSVRVYGHGTISGERIPHWNDYTPAQANIENKLLNVLDINNAYNCRFEGVTLADQANHGVFLWGYGFNKAANVASGLKLLTWRVNNDGIVCTGNSYIEDSFVRHQDDGSYIRGLKISNTVFWSDVNGAHLRASFITNAFNENTPAWALEHGMIVEDIDIIYSRSVFGRNGGVIAPPGGTNSFMGYDSENEPVYNTGQYVTYRNINIEDPRSQRVAIYYDSTKKNDTGSIPNDTAGILYENITMAKPQTWGGKSTLLGTDYAHIRSLYFVNFTEDGNPVDMSDFETNEFTYDIFLD